MGPSWARRVRTTARTAEALALLVVAAAAQRWAPMPRWSWAIGEPGPVPEEWVGRAQHGIPAAAASAAEARVAVAVGRASRLLPFEPTCLAQACAGQVMLRRRGEPGAVVVGLRPAAATQAEPAALGSPSPRGSLWEAHAWLLGSGGALTGGAAAFGFTATTVFRPNTSPAGAS